MGCVWVLLSWEAPEVTSASSADPPLLPRIEYFNKRHGFRANIAVPEGDEADCGDFPSACHHLLNGLMGVEWNL